MTNIAMQNHNFIGTTHYKWPCSVVMVVVAGDDPRLMNWLNGRNREDDLNISELPAGKLPLMATWKDPPMFHGKTREVLTGPFSIFILLNNQRVVDLESLIQIMDA